MGSKALRVGGIQPFSTIDYPGHLAAVLFTQGCPWRCVYCHNPRLQASRSAQTLPWESVIEFLKSRIGLLDAVVFSGGEPTAQSSIIAAIEQLKSLGFKVGMHSAGIYPKRLKEILPLLDWIGLDIKAQEQDYTAITGVENSGAPAWQSAQQVLQSKVAYQLRITAHSNWLPAHALEAVKRRLLAMGSVNTVVQTGIIPGASGGP